MEKKKRINRRDFIKSSVTGAAGFAMIGGTTSKSLNPNPPFLSPQKKIIYRTLGKTGIKLPIVSMGANRTLDANLYTMAIDNGLKYIDSAHIYQNGRNEELVSKGVRGFPRDSFIIGTKITSGPRHSHNLDEVNENVIREKINTSLKRLNMDYVDILYLHDGNNRDVPLSDGVLKVLEEAKKEGKARFVGVSTHRGSPEVIQAVIDSKFYDVVLVAYNFKFGPDSEVKNKIAEAANAGVGVVAMKSLAGGWIDRKNRIPVNTKAALKWVLRDTNIHTAIPGISNFDHFNSDFSVMEDLELSEPEKEDLQLETSIEGLYCLGCETCLSQCRQKLPIPDLMRSYMYNYGYRDFADAQDLLLSLDLPDRLCDDCEDCPVNCTEGFNVSDKIQDIVRLKHIPRDLIA